MSKTYPYSKVEYDFLTRHPYFSSLTASRRYCYICFWNYAVYTRHRILTEEDVLKNMSRLYNIHPRLINGLVEDCRRLAKKFNHGKPPLVEKIPGGFKIHGVEELHQTLRQWKEEEIEEEETKEETKRYDYSLVDSVIDHLNEVTGSSYRHSATSRKHVKARLNDGYTVEDCKLVIDYKNAEWGEDDKRVQYLRPITLFATTKFEGYLSAGKKWDKGGRKRLNPVKPAEIPRGN